MKQTLHSPLGAKKWVWAAGAAAVMVVLLRSRLSGAAGTLLTLGILILFIDLLANAVLADFEYAVMDDMFVYKRKFQKREKIIFYVPIDQIVTILPEEDPGLAAYEIRGTNHLIPRFYEGQRQVGIYQENETYFRFLFVPNEELLLFLQKKREPAQCSLEETDFEPKNS